MSEYLGAQFFRLTVYVCYDFSVVLLQFQFLINSLLFLGVKGKQQCDRS